MVRTLALAKEQDKESLRAVENRPRFTQKRFGSLAANSRGFFPFSIQFFELARDRSLAAADLNIVFRPPIRNGTGELLRQLGKLLLQGVDFSFKLFG